MNHTELLEKIRRSRKLRIAAARESNLLFFAMYLAKYATHPTAPFQREMFALTQDPSVTFGVIVAFRESAKSTIFTTCLPLWSVLTDRAHFVLIAGGSLMKARQNLANIREEIENNALLKNDMGPFREERDQWGAHSLVFSKYDAKIVAVSSEQSVRGFRYKHYRPDLLIADDLEDLDSVRTQEGRNKTYQWFKGEFLPLGSHARTFVVGNLLHQDSLIVRLQNDIKSGRMPGEFRAYPLLNAEGQPLWPGRFPTAESIESLRSRINDPITFEREYMLHIIPAEDQVVQREWIQFYEPKNLPKGEPRICIGVDLAIKEGAANDYTAIVATRVYEIHDRQVMFVDKVLNKRMSFPSAINEMTMLDREYKSAGLDPEFLIEDVGLQSAWAQQLREHGVYAKPVKIGNTSKRARLSITANWIKEGRVLFRNDQTPLINQLVGFGIEPHDDMVDALTLVSIDTLSTPPPLEPDVLILSLRRDMD